MGKILKPLSITEDNDLDEHFSSLIIATLVPSITQSNDESIQHLIHTLQKSPHRLQDTLIQEEIKASVQLRITLDRKSMHDMVLEFDDVVHKISHQIVELIAQSDSSVQEIKAIKKELTQLNHVKIEDLTLRHQKLSHIADTLEVQTSQLSKNLNNHQKTISQLNTKVFQLENELKKAHDASKEDFLTKLPNKRSLEEHLTRHESNYKRHNDDYAVIMFDIDFFKHVNDIHGHEAGDYILQQVAHIFQKACRSSDIIGRYGGEEFMGLITHTEHTGVEYFSQKIRKEIERTSFTFKNIHIPLSISIGFAMRNNCAGIKETIEIADKHLYQAKEQGRNQVQG